MTKQRAVQILTAYIDDDIEGMADLDDVQDKLLSFMDEREIHELGYSWILDRKSDET